MKESIPCLGILSGKQVGIGRSCRIETSSTIFQIVEQKKRVRAAQASFYELASATIILDR